uniref:Cytochrome b561 domain-containing protein n=1 Tax=Timema bartmani TaxID=61472 RepID=A0A7R9F2L8_9NEOP|nr:unnamed protein product [Timema bartmani]
MSRIRISSVTYCGLMKLVSHVMLGKPLTALILNLSAMMVYRAFRNNRKRRLKLVHMSINLLAFIIAVVALQAAFDSHNNKKIPNIYSLHSWLGLCAVIIFAAQWVFGFVAFLFPELNASIRSAMMPVHVFFGLLAFVLSVATALIGLTEKAIFVR